MLFGRNGWGTGRKETTGLQVLGLSQREAEVVILNVVVSADPRYLNLLFLLSQTRDRPCKCYTEVCVNT